MSERGGRLIGGRYRLSEQLGSGAMGMVWSGYDELLHRPVAVKEVALALGIPEEESATLRERTLREARAVAVLNQPNVITVYDVVVLDGAPFVVMELVPGRSLAGRLRESGALAPPAAAAVADALAAALVAAHEAGITHRDVKPGNVLLGRDGRVKLTDFGIARSVSEATMTRTGIILGSPAYIAPEVAAGEPVTPAADLWSLGATLYAATVGRTPYDQDANPLATLHEVVHGQPPRSGVDGPLGEVVDGLLAKDPAARMDLLTVRRTVHPLLPTPGESTFDLAGPAPVPAVAPARDDWTPFTPKAAPKPPVPAPAPPAREPERVRPLAGDPGPLPFVPTEHPPAPGRNRWRTPVLTVVVVLLFLVAASGTFAAARMLGGEGLVPRAEAAPLDPATPSTDAPLVTQRGLAQTMNGAQGGGFTVQVPQGWLSFVEQQNSSRLPAASVVHFVSEDGQQAVNVERFPGFYPRLGIEDYLAQVRERQPGTTIKPVTVRPAAGSQAGGGEQPTDFWYRSVESDGTSKLGRTTFGRAVPDGRVLWVLTVQVPFEQEDHGYRDLFGRIAPTFRPES